ncbi:MAG: hypothetical protein MUF19_01270 [Candidatus Pacebacteria bacterium]|jgi:hypothetical protein|nr:hypothetical protein [Candidatus Paceibacterota bacterium]
MNSTTKDTMSPDEEQAFAVFVNAVERYESTLDVAAAEAFEKWLDEHTDDEELLAHLLQTFPQFGEIFADEIEKFGATGQLASA